MDNESDTDVLEGLGNTTIKNDKLESSDEEDEAGDGAPFNRNSGSPPRNVLSNKKLSAKQEILPMEEQALGH